MSRILDRLGPQAIEGEALPPLPSLEAEAQACLQMVQEGRELIAALKRANSRTQRLNGQIDDLCLALGHKLIGMRERVEAGEVGDEAALSWWDWFADFLPGVSRKHAERWMSIASQIEPATAAMEYRQRAAGHERARYERQKKLIRLPSQDGHPEREMELDEEDSIQPEPDTEPEPPRGSPQDPLKAPLDALEEAVACKQRILALMPLMTTMALQQFRITLVEDVEAMERRLK
jgi:hypothetical protein